MAGQAERLGQARDCADWSDDWVVNADERDEVHDGEKESRIHDAVSHLV